MNMRDGKKYISNKSAASRRKAYSLSHSTQLKPNNNFFDNLSVQALHNKSMVVRANQTVDSPIIRARSAKHSAAQMYAMQNNGDKSSRCKQDVTDIKWIGVHKSSCNQPHVANAFPFRKQRTTDQCFANFVYKYGRKFKFAKQSKQPLVFNNVDETWMSNAATSKVKPRLTWFENRKNQCKRQERVLGRNSFQVNWVSMK